jgi:hypothetical protein
MNGRRPLEADRRQSTVPLCRNQRKTGSIRLPVKADFSYWQCYEGAATHSIALGMIPL